MKATLILIALLVALTAAESATAAASTLRVIGSASASGEFAVAAANGSKKVARAMYLRGVGHNLSGFAVVACSRGFSIGSRSATLAHMTSGRQYQLKLPNGGGDCTVTASLSGSGPIKLQVLA